MLCKSCGFKLRKGVTLCGSCGSQVNATDLSVPATQPVEIIDLAPLTGDFANCGIEILDVRAVGQDADGDLKVTAKYRLKNDLATDWDHLVVQMQILNAFGHVIGTTSDEIDQKLSAGQSEEYKATFHYLKSALLAGAPERAFVVASAIASTRTNESLGSVTLPDATLNTLPLKPVTIGGALKLISGSVWRGSVYGHNEYAVNACVLIQSVTRQLLSRVNLELKVRSTSGDDLNHESNTLEALFPGILAAFQFECVSTSKKKLAGASVHLNFDLLMPVAHGLTQRQGILVIAAGSAVEDGGTLPSGDLFDDVVASEETESQEDECADSQEPDGIVDIDAVCRWRSDFQTGKVRDLNPAADVQAMFANQGMGNIAGVVRIYLDYVACTYCKFHVDFERDQCDALVAEDGPYSDIMVAVFEEGYGEPYTKEEPPAGLDYYWDYILDHQSDDDIAEFLYRYLLSMQRSSSNETSFKIPSDFCDRKIEILKRETERTISLYILWAYERTLND